VKCGDGTKCTVVGQSDCNCGRAECLKPTDSKEIFEKVESLFSNITARCGACTEPKCVDICTDKTALDGFTRDVEKVTTQISELLNKFKDGATVADVAKTLLADSTTFDATKKAANDYKDALTKSGTIISTQVTRCEEDSDACSPEDLAELEILKAENDALILTAESAVNAITAASTLGSGSGTDEADDDIGLNFGSSSAIMGPAALICAAAMGSAFMS
jgi:hypothetical protein